ncbi:hypothetical protein Agau_L101066 [Agrobacterium tumefaciens F2]|nr:hypothetical protein Agau_L101066 [Agrobacterium tumefaciens F2]
MSFLAQRGGKAVFDTALSTPVAVLSPNLSFCETTSAATGKTPFHSFP